ncbi:MAG: phenylalanine--tRNA ligase subunit beta [Holosporales bacterium]|jgi:phenylalanyl-tRNA synthetase beta chain|nr:phenylalanine--tRNA ligase subunit beta [Holosporales bacterium]
MKFSYSWLKDHLDTKYTAKEIADKLNEIGFEVEDIEDQSVPLKDIVVARIDAVENHPNADKLHICRVFDGHSVLQIVCGAQNVYGGMKTALVHVGGFVPKFAAPLKEANIRGVVSQGMMCSHDELCLPTDSHEDGIMDIKTDVTPGDALAHALGLDDPVFTISITPNRGDCFSVRGIARELAAAGMGTLKPLAQRFSELGIKPIDMCTLKPLASPFSASCLGSSAIAPIDIFVDTPNCPFFIGAVITGLNNSFSPLWIQKRLRAAGQRPIDALVDVTNFLNFDIGQPLHAYDRTHIHGNVHVRQANEGEELVLLNGQKCALCEADMVIADDEKPLTLAGVMGGEQSGSSFETTDAFLEAAYFDPIAVTLSGQRHILHSESRTRFERGVDPEMTPVAMEWMLALVQHICGGEIVGCSRVNSVPVAPKPTVTLRKARLLSLGGDPSAAEDTVAEDILERLGFEIISCNEDQVSVEVPSWRHDVSIEADLVEEVLRMRGYANLPIQPLPIKLAVTEIDPVARIKNVLCNRGMAEVYTLPFLSEEETKLFELTNEESFVEILKPLNADMAFLQKSLVLALLKIVSFNQSRNCAGGAIFEIESVFSQVKGSVCEDKMLCGMRFGETERNWLNPSRKADIYDVKADLLDVLALCKIDSYQIKTDNLPSHYHPTRSGVVTRGKEVLGYFGELHPKFIKELDLSGPITLFEMFVTDKLVAKLGKGVLKPFNYSKLQPITRDFAFVVDESLQANKLIESIKKVDDLITVVRIFDVYQGQHIEQGKKSIAVEVVFQPRQSTLTDEAIQSLSQKIIAAIEKNCGGHIRA